MAYFEGQLTFPPQPKTMYKGFLPPGVILGYINLEIVGSTQSMRISTEFIRLHGITLIIMICIFLKRGPRVGRPGGRGAYVRNLLGWLRLGWLKAY